MSREGIHMNKRLQASILFPCLIFLIVIQTFAAPIIPIGPIDITGTVSEIKWVPEEKLKGIPGMSGSAGHDRVIPEHFLVTLIDFDGVSAEIARMMTKYLDWNALKSEDQKGRPSFILVRINSNDRNYLMKGSKIKVSDYTVKGDEGGTWTSYGAIDILSQPSLEWEIKNYLESHIEIPSFGGKMFCAYQFFGIDKNGVKDNIYLWTLCMEYYIKNNSLLKGTGVSLPVVLISQGNKILEHKKPVDGQGYGESIRLIFPKKYHKTVFAEAKEFNIRAESLMNDVEERAKKYYSFK